MKVLKVCDLRVQFHDKYAKGESVRGLSFDIAPGEIVGLVGESGSGKSTAMRAVMGLLPERAQVVCQEMRLEGEDITPFGYHEGKPIKEEKRDYDRKMAALRGSKIAMVFQEPLSYLNETVKIGRQITETVRAHQKGCTRAAARERALELLDMVGIPAPEERLCQYPFELSGGMRQRVAIAIAVACGPKLLLADEPTTALDATVQGQILQLLARIAKETQTAILLASHDLGVIASLCSRILVLQDGKLVEEGVSDEIFHEPKEPYTKQLMCDSASLLKLTGRKAGEGVLLSLNHVTKSYESQRAGHLKSKAGGICDKTARNGAVRDVSFEVYKGETFGLVGESGSGKTTLASMAAGIFLPTAGEILYKGIPLRGMQRQIQMVFQDPYASLDPRMTILDTLEEPLLSKKTADSQAIRIQKVEHMLEMTGLSPKDGAKYPRAFSGGQRQRICIARALLAQPGLLVWDEPVSALDVSIQKQILELLETIQKELDISCLFISHDLKVVKRVSQRLGVMYGGSLMELGQTKEVYGEPWHPYTKMLLSAMLTPNPKTARKRRLLAASREPGAREGSRQGCAFLSRCGYAMECCLTARPEMYHFEGRQVACFLYSGEHAGRRSGNYKMTCQI